MKAISSLRKHLHLSKYINFTKSKVIINSEVFSTIGLEVGGSAADMSNSFVKFFKDTEFENGWGKEYQKLNNKCNETYGSLMLDLASQPQNCERNRYNNVHPYDSCRVKLQGLENDYINASPVEVNAAQRKYILTQGPLPETVEHFWLMVYQQKSKGIIMLNKTKEGRKVKCHQYYPSKAKNCPEMKFPSVQLTVTLEDTDTSKPYCVISKLSVKHDKQGEKLSVLHFQFTTWPDFDVPQSADDFLQFLQTVKSSGVLDMEQAKAPPIIHCSAGIGRSGTFALVDSALKIIDKKKSTDGIDLVDMIHEMRKFRWGLIQTSEQLRFAYQAVFQGSKSMGIESSPSDKSFSKKEPMEKSSKLSRKRSKRGSELSKNKKTREQSFRTF